MWAGRIKVTRMFDILSDSPSFPAQRGKEQSADLLTLRLPVLEMFSDAKDPKLIAFACTFQAHSIRLH